MKLKNSFRIDKTQPAKVDILPGGKGLDNIGCGWDDKDTESEGEGQ